MLSERQIRLQLNDLHICITDVLECIDEDAYQDATATLDHMQSDITCLRKEVTELLDARNVASTGSGRRWKGGLSNRRAWLN